METEAGFDEGTWKQMADLGWMGIAIPEEFGGGGSTFVELGVLLEEMGRALLCAPFFSSAVLGAAAILHAGDEGQKKKLLPAIADGSIRAALAFTEDNGLWSAEGIGTKATKEGSQHVLEGIKTLVVDGHTATLLIVAARTGEGIGLFMVDPEQEEVVRTPLPGIDWTRKQARIELNRAKATPLGEKNGEGALAQVLDRAAVALASEMVGGAQWCLDTAVDYAKEREQFGRPIGSFQAVKHKCAEMLMELEMAKSAAYYAAWSAAESEDDLPITSSMAKAYCSDAFFKIASETIQVLGGIGFTWEHDAHLYFKRAKSSQIFLGDGAYHRALLARRLGL